MDSNRPVARRKWGVLLPNVAVFGVAFAAWAEHDMVLAALTIAVFALLIGHHSLTRRENVALARRLRAQVEEVRNREERFAFAAKATRDAIWDLDLAGGTITWGEGVTGLFGWAPADGLTSLEWWSERVHPDDRGRVGASLDEAIESATPSWSEQYRFQRSDGTYAVVVDRGFVVRDAEGRVVRMVGAMMDVTDRQRYEEELAFRAHHDALTGLPNRTLLTDRVVEALRSRRTNDRRVALFFVDLDNFKLINDSYGHEAGDEVLVGVAERLRSCVRPSDLVARFAGDEFVVLCGDVDGEAEAEGVARRVLEVLREPFSIGGRQLHVSACVGLALSGPDVATHDDLLRHADAAVYEAKERGRGRFEVFGAAIRGRAERQVELTAALRTAIERGELHVHYQPIVSLDTGARIGAEALLRWRRDGEWISPLEFVPLAEDSGLIVPIGAWVLDRACATAAGWTDGAFMAVNVSPRQLTDDFVRFVADALDRSALPAGRLCIEVTESVMLEPEGVREVLRRLKDVGVRVAIDDFGTGHSSLANLKRLPCDTVKIDRSFVAAMCDDATDEGIVAAVITVARAAGVGTVAEGVETERQAERLRALGCPAAQGYLFGRPVAAGYESVGSL